MELNNSTQYLPEGKFRDLFYKLKTSVAYRVWGKKLRQYGNFHQGSSFRMLEVGCGAGYFLQYIERRFPACEIHGLDIDKVLLDLLATTLKELNCFYMMLSNYLFLRALLTLFVQYKSWSTLKTRQPFLKKQEGF
jgi:tRNA G46 methylase TrmB